MANEPPLCTCGLGPTTTVGAPGPCPMHAFTLAWEHVGLEWADRWHAMDVKPRPVVVIGESSGAVGLREAIARVCRDVPEVIHVDTPADLDAEMRRAKMGANRG